MPKGYGQNGYGVAPYGDPYIRIFDQKSGSATVPLLTAGVDVTGLFDQKSGLATNPLLDAKVETEGEITTTRIIITGSLD